MVYRYINVISFMGIKNYSDL